MSSFSVEKIITWQAVLTDHQAFTYEALQNIANKPVICFVAQSENLMRQAQGWKDISVDSLRRIVLPKKLFIFQCFKNLLKYRKSIHIFASPFEDYRLIFCLYMALLLRVKIYLISEPYAPIDVDYLSDRRSFLTSLKFVLRPWIYRLYAVILRNQLSGVFTISQLAYEQYQYAGISPKKLFPFGYFIPRAIENEGAESVSKANFSNKPIKLIFVGALIHRKGLDILLDAVRSLLDQGRSISLDIYGARNESYEINECESIRYRGIIPFGKSQEVVSQYDVLILPSRHDGWGVVVNEAVCASVPVVCSSAVGISDVMQSFGAGLIFQSGDCASLANALKMLIDQPNLLGELTIGAKLAANALQPVVGAQYLFEKLTSGNLSGMQSPWYSRPSL